MSSPLLLGIRQAAEALGIGRDMAYRLVRGGRLRTVQVGRKRLVPRSELSAFVDRELASAGEAQADGLDRRPDDVARW